jgi:hypothetical protein
VCHIASLLSIAPNADTLVELIRVRTFWGTSVLPPFRKAAA